MATTVAQLVTAIEAVAPPYLAEEWDNVGLLLGSPEDRLVGPVVLTIDLTDAVMDEAIKQRASAVIAYHPPIFKALKRITTADPKQRTLLRAARAGMAIYSPHTALDSAPGGLADWLCDALIDPSAKQFGDRRALKPFGHQPPSQQCKIVTFVPASAVDQVRGALASAGAGRIGQYVSCSFSTPGTGTFFGSGSSKPVVGAPGQLEQVAEVKLEMVCGRKSLALALTTLRQLHPYEQPAIDVYELAAHPRRDTGTGRRVTLDQPVTLTALADRVKARLGVGQVMIAEPPALRGREITMIGVCPGDGGSLVDAAVADGCQGYVTGEMSHHEVWACLDRGLSVILAGHTCTERGYLPLLAKKIAASLPEVQLIVSAADHDPLVAR